MAKHLWAVYTYGKVYIWYKHSIFTYGSFSGNINTINFKIFPNHGDIYGFKRKFGKISGEGESPRRFIEISEDMLTFHLSKVNQISTTNS